MILVEITGVEPACETILPGGRMWSYKVFRRRSFEIRCRNP